MYFASGESLYLGAGLLLLAIVSPAFLKHRWILRVRNLLAWVALALMIVASPPFSLIVSLLFFAVFAVWIIASNRPSLSQTTVNLQMSTSILLAASLLILTILEFSHRKMPRITGNASDHLVVIGDSISSGIDPHLAAWPLVLQQMCGVPVRNLARPGAQVSEGLLIASDLRADDHLDTPIRRSFPPISIGTRQSTTTSPSMRSYPKLPLPTGLSPCSSCRCCQPRLHTGRSKGDWRRNMG